MISTLKKSVLILVFSLMISGIAIQQTNAQVNSDGSFGLGVILGEPTGLSLKLWTSSTTAVVGGVAWSLSGKKNTMHLHADYIFHNFNIANVDEGALGLYYGIGARVLLRGDNSKLGIRIPLGINYIFEGAPIEIFAEIVPLFDLIPDTGFNGNGGFGFRYFF